MPEVGRGLVLMVGLLGAALAACGGTVVVDSGSDALEDDATDSADAVGDNDGDSSDGDVGNGDVDGDSDGNVTAGVMPDEIAAACPDIAAEPTVCVTVGYPDQVVALSPATGAVCPITTSGLPLDGPGLSSIAVLGSDLYACQYDGGLVRVSLATGAADVAPVSCDAVTAYQGKLLVMPTWADPNNIGKMELYASFEDAVAQSPEAVFSSPDNNTRMTADGNTLYTAWHATHEVVRWGMPDFDPIPALELQGFDDWILGMSVRNGQDLIAISWSHRLVTFDIASGVLTATVQIDGSYGGWHEGLHCWTK